MTPAEFIQMLDEIDTKMARVRALYEQYFQGMERLEPTVPRKDLERRIEIARKNVPNQTAMRFRFQTVLARFQTYTAYWQRIGRQIEDGTYRRERIRAARRKPRVAHPLGLDYELKPEDLMLEDSDQLLDDALDDVWKGAAESKSTSADPERLDDFDTDLMADERTVIRQPTPRQPPKAAALDADLANATERPQPRSPNPAANPAANPAKNPVPNAGVSLAQKAPARLSVAPPLGAAQRRASFIPSPAQRAQAKPQDAGAAPQARMPITPSTPSTPEAPQRPTNGPDIQNLYERYVSARQQNQESVDKIKYETVAESIGKMIPVLREKHGDKPIDFDVVVINGKVGFKPKVGK